MSLVPDTTPVREFRRRLRGRVIAPHDNGYDEARTLFYGGYDRRPTLIARVADAADVSTVIRLARESGLELAVRSGGHSVAGHSGSDGIVLDLSGMKAMDVDVENRTAWAETGLTAAEFTNATAPHGLGVGLGDTGSVGLGGITLGGGIGYLVRKRGLTIDDLLAAEIVTADGDLLYLDEDTHPDLFWGIRGGGGNFGVATRFRFRLHELDTVVGGMLMLPATPETIEAFVAEADAARWEIFERLEASTARVPVTQIRVLGGAMTRVPHDATAFAHRERRLIVNAVALYEDPAGRATHGVWVDSFAQAVQRGPVGAYVNFLGDEGEAGVRQAYPGTTWERLTQIKGRYDPTNVFRLNQNVPLAG